MTQDAIQVSGAVFVESVRASPYFFTGRHVTSLLGVTSTRPWKRAGKKVSCSASSTSPKVSPMPGVTRYTNTHSCWCDFCSPT